MKIELKDINDDLILQRGDRSVRVFNQLKDVEESDFWVDMGLPSGTLWAKANIDVTTQSKFQEVNGEISPFTYDCSFFSWGNVDGHNPDANNTFDYDFGVDNAGAPFYTGQVYGSTQGATLTGDITPSFDAARVNLGAPWRMPTLEEFQELIDNCTFVEADGTTTITGANKLVTINNITGVNLKANNGNLLFFPCAGLAKEDELQRKEEYSAYWSTKNSGNGHHAKSFRSQASETAETPNRRHYGLLIRPVL